MWADGPTKERGADGSGGGAATGGGGGGGSIGVGVAFSLLNTLPVKKPGI